MTEAQAWRKIALAFEQYNSSGKRNALTRTGLCRAIGNVSDAGWSPFFPLRYNNLHKHMLGQLNNIKNVEAYWFATERAESGLRAMYAQLLCELAKDDER